MSEFKAVFPHETKYSRARFAAQLHLQGTMLSDDAVRELCEEFLRLAAASPRFLTEEPMAFADLRGPIAPNPPLTMEAAYRAMAVGPFPPFIEKGTHCAHGTPSFQGCSLCAADGGNHG